MEAEFLAKKTPSNGGTYSLEHVEYCFSGRSNSWFLSPATPTSEAAAGGAGGGGASFDYSMDRRPSGAVICKASPKRVNQLQEQALIAGSAGGGGPGGLSGGSRGSLSPPTGMANWYNLNLTAYDRAYYASQC